MHINKKYLDGSVMREKRNECGLTIEEFAGAVGVHPRTVSRWEMEGGKPHKRKLQIIATVLDGDAYNQMPQSQSQPQHTDTISIAMMEVVVKAGAAHVRACDLVYLQRVFEECQNCEEVAFTPQLVRTLLKAAERSIPP